MGSVRLTSFLSFLVAVLIVAAAVLPQPGLLRAAVTAEEEEDPGQEEKEKAGLKEALPIRRAPPPRPTPLRGHLALTCHGRVRSLASPSCQDRLPGRRPPLRLLI